MVDFFSKKSCALNQNGKKETNSKRLAACILTATQDPFELKIINTFTVANKLKILHANEPIEYWLRPIINERTFVLTYLARNTASRQHSHRT